MPRPKYRRIGWRRIPGTNRFRPIWQRIRYTTIRPDRYLTGHRPIREVAPQHRADYTQTIIAAAKAARSMGEKWIVRSSYRTRSEQQALYDQYLYHGGNLAARPGTSRHETGKALDLGSPNNEDIGRSVKRRAALGKHGFAFTVPREAWHVEYVGK